MNYYIYIVIIVILFYFYYYHSMPIKELFSNNSNTIILLGDSIFKNNLYVSNSNMSIENQLMLHNPNVINKSQDGAVIVDVFYQIENIPEKYNKKTTNIYISAGGNDIINYYLYKNIPKSNIDTLDVIFKKYTRLINSLLVKFDKSSLFICDIYYPKSNRYKSFHPLIKLWNQKLECLSQSKNITFVRISDEITSDDDLTHEIEPSYKGGLKIVKKIINTIKSNNIIYF